MVGDVEGKIITVIMINEIVIVCLSLLRTRRRISTAQGQRDGYRDGRLHIMADNDHRF